MAFFRYISDAENRGPGQEGAEISIEIQPGASAAAAAEGEVFGHHVAGAVGSVGVRLPEGDAACEARDAAQSRQQVAAGAKASKPRRSRPRIQYKFLPWQVQKLEKVFEESKYPDVFKRRELSRCVYLAEPKLQAWFKNRRAKHRKMLKVAEASPTTVDRPNGEVLKLP